MIVTIESPALMYASQKSTHDWMRAKLDAKIKQQEGRPSNETPRLCSAGGDAFCMASAEI
jgi:hypothetical protein